MSLSRTHALQSVIAELLESSGGSAEDEVVEQLRRLIRRRGQTLPPEPWLRTVAGEIAARRTYVVATETLPRG